MAPEHRAGGYEGAGQFCHVRDIMFNSKTLFVVGAGASNEVGLPIGTELKSQIATKIDIRFEDGYKQDSGDHEITKALQRHVALSNPGNRDINPYLHVAWKVRDAMPLASSIDNYIDAHRDNEMVALCGKLGIAKVILEAERNSKLYVGQGRYEGKMSYENLENTWYLSLVQLLTESVRKSEIDNIFNNVSFISFNYDRCIEHFLKESIINFYDISDDKSQELINKLQILHPYGIVGLLPWQIPAGNVPFGASPNGDRLLDIAGQIKTFTERIEEEAALAAIRQEVQDAETIVFLGFAFHQLNMQLLKPGGASPNYS